MLQDGTGRASIALWWGKFLVLTLIGCVGWGGALGQEDDDKDDDDRRGVQDFSLSVSPLDGERGSGPVSDLHGGVEFDRQRRDRRRGGVEERDSHLLPVTFSRSPSPARWRGGAGQPQRCRSVPTLAESASMRGRVVDVSLDPLPNLVVRIRVTGGEVVGNEALFARARR